MTAPRLIAFEGVDGAGKTTVLSLVADELRQRGERVFLPRAGKEHSSQPTRMIRRLTRDARNFELSAEAELLLYCAREAQIVQELIRPALAEGQTVLVDRSFLTPVVIGAFGRGVDRQWCESTARAASLRSWPDVTLLFDVHPRTSRLRKRIEKVRTRATTARGRKGLAGSSFKERIRDGYLQIAEEAGYPVFHAERATPDVVAKRVLQYLDTGARPEVTESESDRTPCWQVESDDFDGACRQLPPSVGLFLNNGLIAGRALRQRYVEQEPELVAWSMDPMDPLRERLLATQPDYALRGLSRCPLGEAPHSSQRDLRLAGLNHSPDAALRALRYVQCAESDALRERHAASYPGAVLASLAGRDDATALALRARCWKEADVLDRVSSLVGCDDDDAWQRRQKLFDKSPELAIETLRRVPGARSDEVLKWLAPHMPKLVLNALTGRSDDTASTLRRELIDTGREVIESTGGVDDEASWALRLELADSYPSTVIHSLRGLNDSERRRELLSRCERAGRGDLHTARRIVGLAEYENLPAWCRAGTDADAEQG